MPKLTRLGVSYIGILADWQTYRNSLSDPLRQDRCGKEYILGHSVWLRSLQHGKLIWLHGEKDVVYVGSHNLTRAGFNDQLEVTAKLDSSDPEHRAAIRAAHRAVSELVKGSVELTHIWDRVAEPAETTPVNNVHFLWSRHESLMHQLQGIIGHVEYLRVVTPYLDAFTLGELTNSISAKQTVLDLPFEGADTPLEDATKTVSNLITRVVEKPLVLHGKVYEFASGSVKWLAVGSANCTNAGIGKSIDEGGNSEFLVLFPAESLLDKDVKFVEVNEAKEYPGTGRRWDDDGHAGAKGIQYFSAKYEKNKLSVVWECEGYLENPYLFYNGNNLPIVATPAIVSLETKPPQSILLSGTLRGEEVSAKTWVMFIDELTINAASRNISRRRSYLESGDPTIQVLGIEFEIMQLINSLFTSTSKPEHVEAHLGHEPSIDKLAEAIEIFEFSADPIEIIHYASKLITGNNSMDPLVAIRALIAKIYNPPPLDSETDEDTIEEYSFRQTKAKRRTSDLLVKHLRSLSAIDADSWNMVSEEQIKHCLQVTLEVSVLLWWKVIQREQENTASFVEAILGLLETIEDNECCRVACNNTEILGPLILAIGTAADSASEETERVLLRGHLDRIAMKKYREITQEWSRLFPERVAMIVRVAGEKDSDVALEARMRPVYRLLGIADEKLLHMQKTKWGVLMDLITALGKQDPSAHSLLKSANSQYAGHPVWQKCASYIQANQIPPVYRTDKPECSKCHIALPKIHENELKHGGAVICQSCGGILLFGKLL